MTEELTGRAFDLRPIDGTYTARTGSEHGCSENSLGGRLRLCIGSL